MTVEEVTSDAYGAAVKGPCFVYAGSPFNRLNEAKADKVFYLLFRDTKYRLGIVGGIAGNTFCSPFSAPFGGFIHLGNEDVRLSFIEEAIRAFGEWAQARKIAIARITLPPMIYGESFLSRLVNVFYRFGYGLSNVELNHYFDLEKFDDGYPARIWHNARKNLRAAISNGLQFRQCERAEYKEAYNVIKKNREARGFPLRMTWEQVKETTGIVPADFFLVTDPEKNDVAAAIVFTVARSVAQVIYWGDIPEYAGLRTMNFLSFKVFEHYKARGYHYVDIGISTEDSVPNHGLCEFKESIGCDVSNRFAFNLQLGENVRA